MSDCPAIRKLTVRDRDGNPKPVAGQSGTRIQGVVRLAGGAGISVGADDQAGNTAVLAVGGDTAGKNDPVYLAKWLEIINGSTGGSPYSGAPYYIGKVSGQVPFADGTVFLAGDACPQVGLFPAGGGDLAAAATLELYDLCVACLDCEDYEPLYNYVKAIEAFLDANKDNNLSAGIKLFKQYQATVHYWNYLVHAQSLVFTTAPVSGSKVRIKLGYRCLGCGPFNDVKVWLKVVQTAGPIWTEGFFQSLGLVKEPLTLYARVYLDQHVVGNSSSSSSGSLAEPGCYLYIKEIDKTQFAVADLLFDTGLPENSSSSMSSPLSEGENVNTYEITATWLNTHLGTSVSRTHTVEVPV